MNISRRILCSHAANSWSFYSSRGLAKVPSFQKRVDPRNYVGLKNLFKRNTIVLKEFLSDVLDEDPIKSVKFTDNEPIDVVCHLESGKIIIVETLFFNFIKRAVSHASHVYSTQLNEGFKFCTLNPVVLVTISDYNMFPVSEVPDFYSKHIISNFATGETIKELKWIFIELQKFPKKEDEVAQLKNDKEIWTYFFKYASIMKEEDLEKKSVLQTALQSLDMSSWEEKDRIAYTRSLLKRKRQS